MAALASQTRQGARQRHPLLLPLISRASDSDSEDGMADDTKQKVAGRQAQTPHRTLEKCRSGTTTRHVMCAQLPPLTARRRTVLAEP